MKVAGKLVALLGLPLLILFSIFASGVYCGATRADRVVELEQKWLRIDPPPGRLVGGAEPPAPSDGGETGDAPSEPAQPTKPPAEPTEPPAQPTEPAPAQPSEPAPAQPSGPQTDLAIATADPVGPELRQQFDETRKVRVQIMVDPALVVAREDWLTYVAALFDATRRSYGALFGVDLQLHGVVVWDAAAGADADELRTNLAARPRDGADVLLGIVAREQPAEYAPRVWLGGETGDHALVFADLGRSDRYYRNMLRALAMLFGAEPTDDPEARRRGSFMSDAEPTPGAAPVIDPSNRGRVIINKQRRFAGPASNPDAPREPSEPSQPSQPSQPSEGEAG